MIQQQALWGKCKENVEPGSASLPSLSRKWYQLLLFAKAVNEFPFLMDSGLSATSCSLEKGVTLLCCSEKQGTWPYPACSRVNLNCSLSLQFRNCPASCADLNTEKCLVYKHIKGKLVLLLPCISPSLPGLVSLIYFPYPNYGDLFFTEYILVICWNS